MLTLSGVEHIPNRITYKETYSAKGRSQEGQLLSRFHGQFGIADVIGYHNCGPEDPHGSTHRLLNNAEVWRVFKLPKGRRQLENPEERGLQCIAISGEGKALVDPRITDDGTPSPGELLESILHGIIGKYCQCSLFASLLLTFTGLGHYKLFEKGILHRDITSDNILRYSEPVWRPAVDK